MLGKSLTNQFSGLVAVLVQKSNDAPTTMHPQRRTHNKVLTMVTLGRLQKGF